MLRANLAAGKIILQGTTIPELERFFNLDFSDLKQEIRKSFSKYTETSQERMELLEHELQENEKRKMSIKK